MKDLCVQNNKGTLFNIKHWLPTHTYICICALLLKAYFTIGMCQTSHNCACQPATKPDKSYCMHAYLVDQPATSDHCKMKVVSVHVFVWMEDHLLQFLNPCIYKYAKWWFYWVEAYNWRYHCMHINHFHFADIKICLPQDSINRHVIIINLFVSLCYTVDSYCLYNYLNGLLLTHTAVFPSEYWTVNVY